MARGWFQYVVVPSELPPGAVVDGDTVYFDGSFTRAAILDARHAAIAGEVLVDDGGVRVHIRAGWTLSRAELDELPTGAIAVPPWVRLNPVAALSPDGRKLAVAHGRRIVVVDLGAPDDPTVTRWNPLDRQVVATDGNRAATSSHVVELAEDATPHAFPERNWELRDLAPGAMVWNRRAAVHYTDETGVEIGAVDFEAEPFGATLACDASVIVTAQHDGIAIVDTGTGTARARIGDTDERSDKRVLARRALRGAVVLRRGEVRRLVMFALPSGAVRATWELPAELRALAISDDGTQVVAATVTDTVTWYDERSPSPRWTRLCPANAAAIAPDGATLALAVSGAVVGLDARDGAERARVQAHPGRIAHLAFRDDGALVSIGDECTTIVWPRSSSPRPAMPPAGTLVPAVLAHGRDTLANAAAAALAAESAPWQPTGERWPITGHGSLPGLDGRFDAKPPTTSPPKGELHVAGPRRWMISQVEAVIPEGDDDDVDYGDDHPMVYELRVVEGDAVVASLAFQKRPAVVVNHDGSLAAIAKGASVLVVDHQLHTTATLKPKSRSSDRELAWSEDGEVLLVSDRDQHLEAFRPRLKRNRQVCAFDDARVWGLVGPRTLAVRRGSAPLEIIGLDRGEVERTIAVGDIDRVFPAGSGAFATVGANRYTVYGADGTKLREGPAPTRGGVLSADGTIWIDGDERYRLSDGAPLHDHARTIVALAATDHRIASLTDPELIVRDPRDGTVSLRGSFPYFGSWALIGQPGVALLGDRLAVCAGETLRVVDLRDGAWSAAAPSGLVAIAATADRLVTAHRRGVVRTWDPETGSVVHELATPPNVRRVAVDAALARVLIATDTAIALLAIATGETLAIVPLPEPYGVRIALAPDGTTFAVKTRGVRTYDNLGRLLVERADYGPETVAYRSADALAIADSTDVLVIDPRTGAERTREPGKFVSLAAAGDRLICGGDRLAIL